MTVELVYFRSFLNSLPTSILEKVKADINIDNSIETGWLKLRADRQWQVYPSLHLCSVSRVFKIRSYRLRKNCAGDYLGSNWVPQTSGVRILTKLS